MRKIINLFIIILLLSISACEQDIDWDLPNSGTKTLAVQSIITNEYKHQEVRLSLSNPNPNIGFPPATGATVSVSNGIDIMNFTETSERQGTYISNAKFAATINDSYYLNVDYNSKLYSATTHLIPVNISNSLSYVPVDTLDEFYRINWIASEYSYLEQAMYNIVIDWLHLGNNNLSDTITRAELFHYTLNTIDVSYTIFPQDKENIIFPKGSIIVEKKYSLTDKYADYLRALLANTEWQGSLFEDARANLPSNISNNGLGFFSACSVISDTIIVQ